MGYLDTIDKKYRPTARGQYRGTNEDTLAEQDGFGAWSKDFLLHAGKSTADTALGIGVLIDEGADTLKRTFTGEGLSDDEYISKKMQPAISGAKEFLESQHSNRYKRDTRRRAEAVDRVKQRGGSETEQAIEFAKNTTLFSGSSELGGQLAPVLAGGFATAGTKLAAGAGRAIGSAGLKKLGADKALAKVAETGAGKVIGKAGRAAGKVVNENTASAAVSGAFQSELYNSAQVVEENIKAGRNPFQGLEHLSRSTAGNAIIAAIESKFGIRFEHYVGEGMLKAAGAAAKGGAKSAIEGAAVASKGGLARGLYDYGKGMVKGSVGGAAAEVASNYYDTTAVNRALGKPEYEGMGESTIQSAVMGGMFGAHGGMSDTHTRRSLVTPHKSTDLMNPGSASGGMDESSGSGPTSGGQKVGAEAEREASQEAITRGSTFDTSKGEATAKDITTALDNLLAAQPDNPQLASAVSYLRRIAPSLRPDTPEALAIASLGTTPEAAKSAIRIAGMVHMGDVNSSENNGAYDEADDEPPQQAIPAGQPPMPQQAQPQAAPQQSPQQAIPMGNRPQVAPQPGAAQQAVAQSAPAPQQAPVVNDLSNIGQMPFDSVANLAGVKDDKGGSGAKVFSSLTDSQKLSVAARAAGIAASGRKAKIAELGDHLDNYGKDDVEAETADVQRVLTREIAGWGAAGKSTSPEGIREMLGRYAVLTGRVPPNRSAVMDFVDTQMQQIEGNLQQIRSIQGNIATDRIALQKAEAMLHSLEVELRLSGKQDEKKSAEIEDARARVEGLRKIIAEETNAAAEVASSSFGQVFPKREKAEPSEEQAVPTEEQGTKYRGVEITPVEAAQQRANTEEALEHYRRQQELNHAFTDEGLENAAKMGDAKRRAASAQEEADAALSALPVQSANGETSGEFNWRQALNAGRDAAIEADADQKQVAANAAFLAELEQEKAETEKAKAENRRKEKAERDTRVSHIPENEAARKKQAAEKWEAEKRIKSGEARRDAEKHYAEKAKKERQDKEDRQAAADAVAKAKRKYEEEKAAADRDSEFAADVKARKAKYEADFEENARRQEKAAKDDAEFAADVKARKEKADRIAKAKADAEAQMSPFAKAKRAFSDMEDAFAEGTREGNSRAFTAYIRMREAMASKPLSDAEKKELRKLFTASQKGDPEASAEVSRLIDDARTDISFVQGVNNTASRHKYAHPGSPTSGAALRADKARRNTEAEQQRNWEHNGVNFKSAEESAKVFEDAAKGKNRQRRAEEQAKHNAEVKAKREAQAKAAPKQQRNWERNGVSFKSAEESAKVFEADQRPAKSAEESAKVFEKQGGEGRGASAKEQYQKGKAEKKAFGKAYAKELSKEAKARVLANEVSRLNQRIARMNARRGHTSSNSKDFVQLRQDIDAFIAKHPSAPRVLIPLADRDTVNMGIRNRARQAGKNRSVMQRKSEERKEAAVRSEQRRHLYAQLGAMDWAPSADIAALNGPAVTQYPQPYNAFAQKREVNQTPIDHSQILAWAKENIQMGEGLAALPAGEVRPGGGKAKAKAEPAPAKAAPAPAKAEPAEEAPKKVAKKVAKKSPFSKAKGTYAAWKEAADSKTKQALLEEAKKAIDAYYASLESPANAASQAKKMKREIDVAYDNPEFDPDPDDTPPKGGAPKPEGSAETAAAAKEGKAGKRGGTTAEVKQEASNGKNERAEEAGKSERVPVAEAEQGQHPAEQVQPEAKRERQAGDEEPGERSAGGSGREAVQPHESGDRADGKGPEADEKAGERAGGKETESGEALEDAKEAADQKWLNAPFDGRIQYGWFTTPSDLMGGDSTFMPASRSELAVSDDALKTFGDAAMGLVDGSSLEAFPDTAYAVEMADELQKLEDELADKQAELEEQLDKDAKKMKKEGATKAEIADHREEMEAELDHEYEADINSAKKALKEAKEAALMEILKKCDDTVSYMLKHEVSNQDAFVTANVLDALADGETAETLGLKRPLYALGTKAMERMVAQAKSGKAKVKPAPAKAEVKAEGEAEPAPAKAEAEPAPKSGGSAAGRVDDYLINNENVVVKVHGEETVISAQELLNRLKNPVGDAKLVSPPNAFYIKALDAKKRGENPRRAADLTALAEYVADAYAEAFPEKAQMLVDPRYYRKDADNARAVLQNRRKRADIDADSVASRMESPSAPLLSLKELAAKDPQEALRAAVLDCGLNLANDNPLDRTYWDRLETFKQTIYRKLHSLDKSESLEDSGVLDNAEMFRNFWDSGAAIRKAAGAGDPPIVKIESDTALGKMAHKRVKKPKGQKSVAEGKGWSDAESVRSELSADSTVGKAVGALEKSGALEIVDSEADLPDTVETDGRTGGYYDPSTGKAYLVAENIAPGHARGVLLHEVGNHMVHDESMTPIDQRAVHLIREGAKNGDPLMLRVMRRLRNAGETLEGNPQEARAYLTEEAARESKPAKGIVGFLRRFRAAVNAWVTKHVGNVPGFRLSADDMVRIAEAGTKLAAEGKRNLSGKGMFSKAAVAAAEKGVATPAARGRKEIADDRLVKRVTSGKMDWRLAVERGVNDRLMKAINGLNAPDSVKNALGKAVDYMGKGIKLGLNAVFTRDLVQIGQTYMPSIRKAYDHMLAYQVIRNRLLEESKYVQELWYQGMHSHAERVEANDLVAEATYIKAYWTEEKPAWVSDQSWQEYQNSKKDWKDTDYDRAEALAERWKKLNDRQKKAVEAYFESTYKQKKGEIDALIDLNKERTTKLMDAYTKVMLTTVGHVTRLTAQLADLRSRIASEKAAGKDVTKLETDAVLLEKDLHAYEESYKSQRANVTELQNAVLDCEKDIRANIGMLATPYAPLNRTGDHIIVGKSAEYEATEKRLDELDKLRESDPERYGREELNKEYAALTHKLDSLKGDGKSYWVDSADGIYTARAKRAALQEQHPELRFAEPFPTAEIGNQRIVNTSLMENVVAKAEVMLGEMKLPDAERSAILSLQTAANEMMIRSMISTAIQKHELTRKNVRGFDTNMLSAYQSYSGKMAGRIASIRTDLKTKMTFNDMLNEVKNAPEEQRELATDIYNQMRKRNDLIAKQDPSHWSSAVQRFNAWMMLFTSPGYYFQNATQPFMMSVPYMAGHFGLAKVTGEMGKVYTTLTKNFASYYGKPWKLEDLKKDDICSQEELDMLQNLNFEGILDVSLQSEYGELNDSENWVARKYKLVSDKFVAANQRVEMMNRVATALVAYRNAKANPDKIKGSGGAYAQSEMFRGIKDLDAYAYAAEVIYRTHGDYSGLNSPSMMLQGGMKIGGLEKLVFQFRKYQLIQIGSYAHMLKQAFNGATPEERALGRREFLYTAGTTLATCGIKGTILLPQLLALGNWAFGEEDEGDEEFAERLLGSGKFADILLGGMPEFAGLPVSSYIGAGEALSIFPFYREKAGGKPGDWSGAVADALYNISGPTGSQADKLVRGFGTLWDSTNLVTDYELDPYFKSGQFMKAWELLLPKGFGNALKAVDYMNNGVKSASGNTTYVSEDDFSGWDAFTTFIGMPSDKISKAYETRGRIMEKRELLDSKAALIKSHIKNGDTAAAMKEIARRNRLAQKINQLDPSSKLKAKTMSDFRKDIARAEKKARGGS